MRQLSSRSAWFGRSNAVQLLFAVAVMAAAASDGNARAESQSRVDRGRELAHDFNKGNCLACHSAPQDREAVTLANIAPPLMMMRKRYPEREVLRHHIWDPMQRNPNTIMPPYGKHRILTDEEIELVIDYLYTL
jgi:sulfur-oxidizing protein SoxX